VLPALARSPCDSHYACGSGACVGVCDMPCGSYHTMLGQEPQWRARRSVRVQKHTHTPRAASCASLIVGSMSYPVRGSTLEGMQRCAPEGARSAVSLIDQRTSGGPAGLRE
jgi:hypothetical protein